MLEMPFCQVEYSSGCNGAEIATDDTWYVEQNADGYSGRWHSKREVVVDRDDVEMAASTC